MGAPIQVLIKKNFKEKWFLSPQPLHYNICHSSITERLKCCANGIQCDKPSLGHHVSQAYCVSSSDGMAVQALWANATLLTTILCAEQVALHAQRSLPMFLILKCTMQPSIPLSFMFFPFRYVEFKIQNRLKCEKKVLDEQRVFDFPN